MEILVHLVSVQFDLNRSTMSHLPTAVWKSALDNLNKILDILEKNPSVKLQESGVEDISESVLLDEEGEERELKQVSGNLVSFIQRLDDEFIKTLQLTDPHIGDYISRLQDENALLEIAQRGQESLHCEIFSLQTEILRESGAPCCCRSNCHAPSGTYLLQARFPSRKSGR